MRLWHEALIPVLPRKQLIAQWRECCCIARNIQEKGTPNHLLVNKIMNYPPLHFILYTNAIQDEMRRRGYRISEKSHDVMCKRFVDMHKYADKFDCYTYQYVPSSVHDIFRGWHNDTYLRQCFYNLQEKFMCGGIPTDEWKRVLTFVQDKHVI